MAEMNLQEERKHCTKVYKKWDFVRRIVDLYAEGVSWKGCDKLEVDAVKIWSAWHVSKWHGRI